MQFTSSRSFTLLTVVSEFNFYAHFRILSLITFTSVPYITLLRELALPALPQSSNTFIFRSIETSKIWFVAER